ncbi:MAG TPA: hypothetical protein VHB98_00875 [Chloroflexota bacterium]|nr:hypothetical protein [Chloroflexota bacterium]
METTPATGGYTGTGDLVQEGLWRADVLVRTHAGEGVFRAVPIVFLVGLEPAVLSAPAIDTQYGPAVLRLDSTPGPPSGASGKSGPHADVASALEGWQPGCRASGGGSCPNLPDAPLRSR